MLYSYMRKWWPGVVSSRPSGRATGSTHVYCTDVSTDGVGVTLVLITRVDVGSAIN